MVNRTDKYHKNPEISLVHDYQNVLIMTLRKTLIFVMHYFFRKEITLLSCLKYDPSQLLNQNTQKMLRFYITVKLREKSLIHHR